MKKTYIMPATQIVKVQTNQMMTVSMYGKDATSEAMSRSDRSSDWDDDDFDE